MTNYNSLFQFTRPFATRITGSSYYVARITITNDGLEYLKTLEAQALLAVHQLNIQKGILHPYLISGKVDAEDDIDGSKIKKLLWFDPKRNENRSVGFTKLA